MTVRGRLGDEVDAGDAGHPGLVVDNDALAQPL